MRHAGTMRGTLPYPIPIFHKDRSPAVVTRVKTMRFGVAVAVRIDPYLPFWYLTSVTN